MNGIGFAVASAAMDGAHDGGGGHAFDLVVNATGRVALVVALA